MLDGDDPKSDDPPAIAAATPVAKPGRSRGRGRRGAPTVLDEARMDLNWMAADVLAVENELTATPTSSPRSTAFSNSSTTCRRSSPRGARANVYANRPAMPIASRPDIEMAERSKPPRSAYGDLLRAQRMDALGELADREEERLRADAKRRGIIASTKVIRGGEEHVGATTVRRSAFAYTTSKPDPDYKPSAREDDAGPDPHAPPTASELLLAQAAAAREDGDLATANRLSREARRLERAAQIIAEQRGLRADAEAVAQFESAIAKHPGALDTSKSGIADIEADRVKRGHTINTPTTPLQPSTEKKRDG